jgi:hypothetical protein
MRHCRALAWIWRQRREEQAAQPNDGEIKARDVRLGAVVCFQGLMAHLREVRLIGAACAIAISTGISSALRDVRSPGHER